MSNLNLTTLKTLVETSANSVANTTSAQTILQIASAMNKSGVDTFSAFSTIASLPDTRTDNVPVGTMAFVEETQSIYVAGENQWLDLLGKIARIDGTELFGWGSNVSGKLGINCCVGIGFCSPVSVVGGFTDWCQISAGDDHATAIRTNGTLWTWGLGTCGRLGDGTTTNKSSPVSVIGGFTDWCQVSAGNRHTAAVRTNGTLWTWGYNSQGQLGHNTSITTSSPVSVAGGFTDWCQVSAGEALTAAVRTNGTLWTWGKNDFGSLGDNTTVSKSSPVQVAGIAFDWCNVATGSDHILALKCNGTLWAWGTAGALGDNSTVSKSSPVSVVGGFTDWCQIAAGNCLSSAIRSNGTLWTWGTGFLGNGIGGGSSSPVSVITPYTDWCLVSAGSSLRAAMRTNGSIWTWGDNSSGELGDGTVVSKTSPISVVSTKNDWRQVSVGGLTHMMAF